MKLVIFDCDGVLVNTEELVDEAHREAFAEYGLSFSLQALRDLFTGLAYEDYLKKRNEVYKDAFGVDLPPEFHERLHEIYKQKEPGRLRAVDGIADLLGSLQKAGIPFCVASNSDAKGLERKLKQTGLFDFIHPHIFSRDHVVAPKPAPDIYLFAAARMGGIDPAECIVVEDSVPGARAGLAAGMHVIGFDRQDQPLPGDGRALLAAGAAEIAFEAIILKQRIFSLIDPSPPRQAPQRRNPPPHPSL